MSELLLGGAAVAFLVWMIATRESDDPASSQRKSEDEGVAGRVGVLTGLMGGDITDAAVAKQALDRAGNSATIRDQAAAVSMQHAYRPDSP